MHEYECNACKLKKEEMFYYSPAKEYLCIDCIGTLQIIEFIENEIPEVADYVGMQLYDLSKFHADRIHNAPNLYDRFVSEEVLYSLALYMDSKNLF